MIREVRRSVISLWWRSIEKWDFIMLKCIILGEMAISIGDFLWGNYFLFKKVLSIFDFEKNSNSKLVSSKRLGVAGPSRARYRSTQLLRSTRFARAPLLVVQKLGWLAVQQVSKIDHFYKWPFFIGWPAVTLEERQVGIFRG